MPISQDEILKIFSKLLQKHKINYCLVGGLAANAYTRNDMFRQTKDIDFAVEHLSKTKAEKILKEAQRESLPKLSLVVMKDHNEPIDSMPGDRATVNPMMYCYRGAEVMVDLLPPNNVWVPAAIENAIAKTVFDQELQVISPEELIAAKIISFADRGTRRKDLADLRQLCLLDLNTDRIEGILELAEPKWRLEFLEVLTPPIQTLVRKYSR
jgi:hypothetical protein